MHLFCSTQNSNNLDHVHVSSSHLIDLSPGQSCQSSSGITGGNLVHISWMEHWPEMGSKKLIALFSWCDFRPVMRLLYLTWNSNNLGRVRGLATSHGYVARATTSGRLQGNERKLCLYTVGCSINWKWNEAYCSVHMMQFDQVWLGTDSQLSESFCFFFSTWSCLSHPGYWRVWFYARYALALFDSEFQQLGPRARPCHIPWICRPGDYVRATLRQRAETLWACSAGTSSWNESYFTWLGSHVNIIVRVPEWWILVPTHLNPFRSKRMCLGSRFMKHNDARGEWHITWLSPLLHGFHNLTCMPWLQTRVSFGSASAPYHPSRSMGFISKCSSPLLASSWWMLML